MRTLTGAPKGAQLFLPCLKKTGNTGLVKCKCASGRGSCTLTPKWPVPGTLPELLRQVGPMENNPWAKKSDGGEMFRCPGKTRQWGHPMVGCIWAFDGRCEEGPATQASAVGLCLGRRHMVMVMPRPPSTCFAALLLEN